MDGVSAPRANVSRLRRQPVEKGGTATLLDASFTGFPKLVHAPSLLLFLFDPEF